MQEAGQKVIRELPDDVKGMKAWARQNLTGNQLDLAMKLDDDAKLFRIEASKAFISGLKVAEDAGGNPLLVAESLWKYGGAAALQRQYRESGQIADLVGAITGNKWGGGHSNSYYKRDKWGGVSGSQQKEAFAQVFRPSI